MQRYDPMVAPDPEQWADLVDGERIDIIRAYHRKARISLPNAPFHAAIHAIVETQIALGDEIPVARTVDRLMAEGLDRHDAIHAVGIGAYMGVASAFGAPIFHPPISPKALASASCT